MHRKVSQWIANYLVQCHWNKWFFWHHNSRFGFFIPSVIWMAIEDIYHLIRPNAINYLWKIPDLFDGKTFKVDLVMSVCKAGFAQIGLHPIRRLVKSASECRVLNILLTQLSCISQRLLYTNICLKSKKFKNWPTLPLRTHSGHFSNLEEYPIPTGMEKKMSLLETLYSILKYGKGPNWESRHLWFSSKSIRYFLKCLF